MTDRQLLEQVKAVINKQQLKVVRLRLISLSVIAIILLFLPGNQKLPSSRNLINPVQIGIMSEEEAVYIQLMKHDVSPYCVYQASPSYNPKPEKVTFI